MDPIYILVALAILSSVLGYYLLLGLTKLLENLAKNSGQSLKSIFVFIALIGCSYVLVNRDNADQMLKDLISSATFWEDDSQSDEAYSFGR